MLITKFWENYNNWFIPSANHLHINLSELVIKFQLFDQKKMNQLSGIMQIDLTEFNFT